MLKRGNDVICRSLDHEVFQVVDENGVLLLASDAVLRTELVHESVVNGLPEWTDVVVNWRLLKAVKTHLESAEP